MPIRLDAHVFDLPVQELRRGYLSDIYFWRGKVNLEHHNLHPDVTMQVQIVVFEGDLLAPEINVAEVAAAQLLNRQIKYMGIQMNGHDYFPLLTDVFFFKREYG